jgi:hypothetical protein
MLLDRLLVHFDEAKALEYRQARDRLGPRDPPAGGSFTAHSRRIAAHSSPVGTVPKPAINHQFSLRQSGHQILGVPIEATSYM